MKGLIEKSNIFSLKDEVEYIENGIETRLINFSKGCTATLIAFDKEQEIGTHTAKGDAFVTCLEGKGEIKINDDLYTLNSGESIIIPALEPHSVKALEKYKMLLIVM